MTKIYKIFIIFFSLSNALHATEAFERILDAWRRVEDPTNRDRRNELFSTFHGLVWDLQPEPTECFALFQSLEDPNDRLYTLLFFVIKTRNKIEGWENFGAIMEQLVDTDLCPLHNRDNTREFLRRIRGIITEYRKDVTFADVLVGRKMDATFSDIINASLDPSRSSNDRIRDLAFKTAADAYVNGKRQLLPNQPNNDIQQNIAQENAAQQTTTQNQQLTEQQQSPSTSTSFRPISNYYINVPPATSKENLSLWNRYKYWSIPVAVLGSCIPPAISIYKIKKLENIIYDPQSWINKEKMLSNKQFLAKTHNELISEWLPSIMQKYKSLTHKQAVEQFLTDLEVEINTLKKYILKANFFRGIGLGSIFGFYEDIVAFAQGKLEVALFLEDNFNNWLIKENKRILGLA